MLDYFSWRVFNIKPFHWVLLKMFGKIWEEKICYPIIESFITAYQRVLFQRKIPLSMVNGLLELVMATKPCRVATTILREIFEESRMILDQWSQGQQHPNLPGIVQPISFGGLFYARSPPIEVEIDAGPCPIIYSYGALPQIFEESSFQLLNHVPSDNIASTLLRLTPAPTRSEIFISQSESLCVIETSPCHLAETKIHSKGKFIKEILHALCFTQTLPKLTDLGNESDMKVQPIITF